MAYVQVPRATSALRATMASMAMVCLSQATCGDPVQGRAEGPVRGGRHTGRARSNAPPRRSRREAEPPRGRIRIGTRRRADTSAAQRARPRSDTSTTTTNSEKRSFRNSRQRRRRQKRQERGRPDESAAERPQERGASRTTRMNRDTRAHGRTSEEEGDAGAEEGGTRGNGVPKATDSDDRGRRRGRAQPKSRAAETLGSDEPIAPHGRGQETQAGQPAVKRSQPARPAARERAGQSEERRATRLGDTMNTTTRAPGASSGADTRADSGPPPGLESSSTRWTGEPFEGSTAEAIYCPVLDSGRWNQVMQELHRRDPGLARRWRESKHQPKPRQGRGRQFTKVP